MNKIILVIFSLSVGLGLQAQKQAKYEDYLRTMLALPPSGAIALLKTYRKVEPENGSIHLQMATIYKKRYEEGDPIKDFDYKIGNAKLALESYQLAEQTISEKEVKKNQEQYFNFGNVNEKGRVVTELDTLLNEISKSKIELEAYIANGPNIYDKFTKSFSHYDKAHKIFTDIVGEYSTFKELYLLFDESVDQKFEALKQEYIQSISFFEEYKQAITSYPIPYNQELLIEAISVYRLDGLESQINFLEKEVSVWNYAQWVDETRMVIADEIASLRKDLISENLRLDQSITTISTDFKNDNLKELKVDKEVLFKLRKYDLNSVVEPIYLYKQEKHDIIHHRLMSQSLDTSKSATLERKLFLYGQLISKLAQTDSSLTKISSKNDKYSYAKYQSFIASQYNSPEEIENYVETESSRNKSQSKVFAQFLQDNLLSKIWSDTNTIEAPYRKRKIPLQVALAPDTVEVRMADYITTHRSINFDGSAYVGGVFLHTKEQKVSAYVAGITSDRKVGWFNEYLLQIDSGDLSANTRIAAFTAIPGGIAVVFNMRLEKTKANQLMIVDEQGEVILNKRLTIDSYPRTLTYNENTNNLFVTFKGDDYLNDIFLETELQMISLDLLGNLQWKHRFRFKGDVQSVVSVDKDQIIFGNFHEMRTLSNTTQQAGADNTSTQLYSIKLSKTGLKDIRFYNTDKVSYLSNTLKVSNNCINLFGNLGKYQPWASLSLESNQRFHIILNKNLDVLNPDH